MFKLNEDSIGFTYENEDYSLNSEDNCIHIINKSEIDINIDVIKDINKVVNKQRNIENSQALPVNQTKGTTVKFTVTKNEIKEIKFKLIGKKRKNLNNKGNRQDVMINRYKFNFFKHVQEILYKMTKNSKFCKLHKIKFESIPKEVYMKPKASENLTLLSLKLKDVLSNKELINSIFELYDLQLIDILNKSIKELMDIYRGKILSKEYYYIELANCYKKFLKQLEEEKVESYIENFKNWANKFEEIFIEKNKHSRQKKKI